jgi:hypothetical protein
MRVRTPLLLAFTLLSCDSGTAVAQDPPPRASAGAPFAVVELFTSEGCDSCPPADRLLTRLREEPAVPGRAVYFLSLHVDYWDDLGWKDPFSSPAFSERQRSYARARGRSGVFTPEAVVNGTTSVNGADEAALRAAVARGAPSETGVSLDAEVREKEIVVRYDVAAPPAGAALVLAAYERTRTSVVSRGENAGRTLRHDDVVRAVRAVPLDPSSPRGTARVALPQGTTPSDVVGFVQLPSMRIVAAASVPARAR